MKKVFAEWKKKADLQKNVLIFFIFAWGLSYDLSKFSDDFTPFSTLKDHS